MPIQYEFHSLQRGFVEAQFLSKKGKSVVLHIADTEDYAYTPHNPGITRVCQDGDYVGVLSVYEGHKKSGWAPLQDRIRKSTGWKIGILDIDKMVEQYRFWKIHNL